VGLGTGTGTGSSPIKVYFFSYKSLLSVEKDTMFLTETPPL